MKKLTLSFLLCVLFSAGLARAEKMDSETQNQVVVRLERVLAHMDKSDSSWLPSQLRLADLLAERGRLRFMNEIEASCQGCKGSVADRKKALSIYGQILNQLKIQEQGIVLFQMAHLHQINNDDKKAQEIFEGILKNQKKYKSDELIAQSRMALGDLHFQRGESKQALAYYKIAYNDKKSPNHGLSLYRIAWCEFNLDHLKTAIKDLETLARSQDLLVKETAQGFVHDASFQNDVLKDLATFYSRAAISKEQINQFDKLSPLDQRKELLLFFAGEADRLGQKQAAAQIYHLYLDDPKLTQDERLNAMMHVAQVNYDKGQSGQSIEDFAQAANAFKQTRCSEDAKCLELQKQMKHYVTELHRSKKSAPDMDVLKAYGIYSKTFPEDTEMALLGAQVAVELNKSDMANILYRHASSSAKDEKLREAALLGEIEAAEKTQNLQTRETAYQHYLELMPKGKKQFEVRYQLAHLTYDRKQWAKAADQFRVLALDKTGTADLRKKSADLALDCLASEKRDADIEKWALEFAGTFPSNQAEYREISRKSVMNQTAKTANDSHASSSDLRDALKKMQTANFAGANDAEKTQLLQNQTIVASKIGDDTALLASLNSLLAMKNLKPAHREETLARKVAIYEKHLDFKSAYSVALQMKFSDLKAFEREMRLATLADLGSMPQAKKHYEAALKSGLSGSRSGMVRSRLVLLSSQPFKELRKQQTELSRFPQLMSETLLLVFAQTHDQKSFEALLKTKNLSHTAAAAFIRKQPFLKHEEALSTRLAQHQLNFSTDSRLQKTIKERIRLLTDIDHSLTEALALKDFTSEVLALSLLQRENERMVRDLFALPAPKGLTAAEQIRYQNLLKSQARPYLAKSKMAQLKLQDFWKNENTIHAIISDYSKARPELRPFLTQEMQVLAEIAPSSDLKSRFQSGLQETLPTQKELLAARDSVRNNPSDTREIEKLKILETKIGHPLMSSYLEGRLGRIQRESVL